MAQSEGVRRIAVMLRIIGAAIIGLAGVLAVYRFVSGLGMGVDEISTLLIVASVGAGGFGAAYIVDGFAGTKADN